MSVMSRYGFDVREVRQTGSPLPRELQRWHYEVSSDGVAGPGINGSGKTGWPLTSVRRSRD